MKKIIFLIICFVLIGLTACSNSTNTGISQKDFEFELNNKIYSLNSDASVLLDELGEDYVLSEAPSCVYKGTDKQFVYKEISIYTYPIDEKDLIDEIIITGSKYKTNRGITVDSSKKDVITAYSDNFKEEEGIITYLLEPDNPKSPALYFILQDDKVVSISYYSASNMP